MSKKEQAGTKVVWGRWCVAVKIVVAVLLLIAVVDLAIVIVEFFGSLVANWLVK